MRALHDVTLGLLAGGRATRLDGADKAWLVRDGVAQVVRLAQRFASEVDAIRVSANRAFDRYAADGLSVVADRTADAGPIGGIEALAAACTTRWLLTVPVDVVAVNDCLLPSLAAAGDRGAYAVDDDGVQPLVALWPVDALRDALHDGLGDGAVQSLQARLGMAAVRLAGVRFGNLNTPADLAAAGVHRAMSAFPTGLSFDDALARVRDVAAQRRLPVERIALSRAHGRILAQDVVAPIDLPAFANSAMDGFALRHADVADGAVLRLVGEQFAGRALDLQVGPGECLRITTGAPMPAGADTVVIREDTVVEDDAVRILASPRPQANVRLAGEDVRAGERVLHAGQRMTPARTGMVAALGVAQLDVARRPTVAVFTTGDELIEPGLPLEPGQIYNSNRELLMGLLRDDGLEPVAWPTLPDDPARVAAMLADAASSFDLVITCGAVSAGERDHIPALLQALGRIVFWKVRMKPGMPLVLGALGEALVLGLPGNPVSVLATWLTLGRVLVDGLQGAAEGRPVLHARLSAAIDKPHARREFLRGRLQPGDDACLHVVPNLASGSHRLRAAAQSDALIVLPEGPQALPAGHVVDVLPY